MTRREAILEEARKWLRDMRLMVREHRLLEQAIGLKRCGHDHSNPPCLHCRAAR